MNTERVNRGAIEAPLISVVVPTFNSGRTIVRALASILAQSHGNLEVIIADDASSDDTHRRVLEFADSRILLLPSDKSVNEGPAVARNRALTQAKGSYIAFLDSDDEWFPEKLRLQLAFLEAHPACSMVVSNAEDVASDGRIIETEFDSTRPRSGPEAWRVLLKYSFIETSSVMARAALVRRLGGFDPKLLVSQDQDLWIRLALEGEVGILPEVLGRIHQVPTGHMTRNRYRKAGFVLPMIERHVRAQAARLSKEEIDEILGFRYQAVGQDLFVHGYYLLGLRLLFQASLRQGNWLHNLVYVSHANPVGSLIKQNIRSALKG